MATKTTTKKSKFTINKQICLDGGVRLYMGDAYAYLLKYSKKERKKKSRKIVEKQRTRIASHRVRGIKEPSGRQKQQDTRSGSWVRKEGERTTVPRDRP